MACSLQGHGFVLGWIAGVRHNSLHPIQYKVEIESFSMVRKMDLGREEWRDRGKEEKKGGRWGNGGKERWREKVRERGEERKREGESEGGR